MNLKKLLFETDSVISELDSYLIKIIHIIKSNQLGNKKIRKSTSAFIEINDFCFDSDALLNYLSFLRNNLNQAIEYTENQISHFRQKRENLEHKYTIYKGLELLLQKTSNPTKIRYAMYSAYGESWEEFIELSTLEILDEMDYGRSFSSKLYRNIEQVLDTFTSNSTPISEVDKNIKFYSMLRDDIPQYMEDLNNRIKIICYLRKKAVA